MNRSRENLKLKVFARKPGILRDPHNINLKRVTHQPQNARVTFRFTAMTQGFGSNLCQSSHGRNAPQQGVDRYGEGWCLNFGPNLGRFLGAQYLSRTVNLQNRVLTSHAHRFYPPANQNASKYENSESAFSFDCPKRVKQRRGRKRDVKPGEPAHPHALVPPSHTYVRV